MPGGQIRDVPILNGYQTDGCGNESFRITGIFYGNQEVNELMTQLMTSSHREIPMLCQAGH